ncbi:Cholinesterase [Triplophysa tibetana]|uniref:Carboxylic ester hydrolase n=1 Tax=Triplophysa tibetana TaxID=1572043 RepID=A0A5A9PDU9_9TELE|nr:Cholinesterase [Triplophysa tibetana]
MPSYGVCSLGLCAVVFVFIRTGSSTEQFNLAALIRGVSSGTSLRDQHKLDLQTHDKNDRAGPVGPKLITKDGTIQGVMVDKCNIFYGIPFADPPVGAYRWKPPVGSRRGEGCTTAPIPEQRACRPASDTCMKNVRRSVKFPTPPLKLLPVMVWIHGGDFIAGSASKALYDSRYISNFTQTVVVSVAYRLGAFGFLVSGKYPKTSAVGNYGILDQQAALIWVQKNIAAFGGDPNRVTIFGESAGAQSVSLHLMIESSKALFTQAVLQSLPFSIPLKTWHESLKLGKNFAKMTNCSLSDIVCLLSLSPERVLTAQIKSSSKLVNPFRFLEVFEIWGPYMDGELIQERSVTAFQKGHWQKEKKVLLGTTSEEGIIFVYGVFTKPVSPVECTIYTTAIFKQHSMKILRKYLPLYEDTDRRDMLAQSASHSKTHLRYQRSPPPVNQITCDFWIVTDYIFLCPSRKSARAGVLSGSSVWMYVFDHVSSDPHVWSGLTFCYQHVCHGAELPFLFDSAPVANFTFTQDERLLSNRMLCYWGSFAHAGDPGSRTDMSPFCQQQRSPSWPRYEPNSGWLVMNLTVHSHAQAGSRNDICDFWDELGIYP